MASTQAVTPDQFDAAFKKLLDEYKDEAYKIAEKSAKKAARGAVKELKATTHVKTGKYARGWTTKQESRGSIFFSVTVYNRTVPGLPHLLNYSHVAGRHRRGRYTGDGHVDAAEATAKAAYYDEVVDKL